MARTARKTGVDLGLHIAALAWSHPNTARLRGGVTAATGAALALAFVLAAGLMAATPPPASARRHLRPPLRGPPCTV